MKRILATLAFCVALIAGSFPAMAQVNTTPRYCGKSAFVNNITTATTTQIAPNVNQAPFTGTPTIGGTAPLTGFYICGYVLIVSGGSGTTAQFVYGFPASLPGTGCGASPTTLSITYPAGTYLDMASMARGFEVPAGNVLCLVTAVGTTPSISVQIYYDNNPL